MTSPADPDPPLPGLRERKKARTLAAIQTEALRLFREHGYEATTVDEIAAAAEVSPSTFFRYFPTKEDVVVRDLYDPLVFEVFKAQPAEMGPIQALRSALRLVWDELTPEQLASERERQELIYANPELRARMMDEVAVTIKLFIELIAERAGRSPDDLEVRIFTGALTGIFLSLMLTAPDASQNELIAQIEAGLVWLEPRLEL